MIVLYAQEKKKKNHISLACNHGVFLVELQRSNVWLRKVYICVCRSDLVDTDAMGQSSSAGSVCAVAHTP